MEMKNKVLDAIKTAGKPIRTVEIANEIDA